MTDNISIEDIMASLDKETRSNLRLGSEVTKEFLPTASWGLNKELGGGLALGKQHTFWGGEGSGKSGLLMQTVGLNQKVGVPCAWIDSEGIFDPEWAVKLGMDIDKIILSKASTISEATDLQIKLIKKGVKLIVIDTVSELLPKSFVDKGGDMKSFEDTGQLGQQAKDLGTMSKMVAGVNFTCAIVHISQQRVNVGSPAIHKPLMATGGKEIGHNDAVRVRLIGTGSQDKLIKENVQRGTKLVEEVVGFPVNWIVQKNRLNGNIGDGEYDFIKKGSTPGVSFHGEVLDGAVVYGIIEKGGAWYTIYDKKVQSRQGAIAYLRENEVVFDKLSSELEAKVKED
jgi:recombination protein RecA